MKAEFTETVDKSPEYEESMQNKTRETLQLSESQVYFAEADTNWENH